MLREALNALGSARQMDANTPAKMKAIMRQLHAKAPIGGPIRRTPNRVTHVVRYKKITRRSLRH
jgi:hypothetical protein